MNLKLSAPKMLYIKPSLIAQGRGVFSSRPFSKGRVIETCPLIKLQDGCDLTPPLKYYAIELTEFAGMFLMLGFGSLYNHSVKPNAEIQVNFMHRDTVRFVALEDIPADTEIFYDYAFDDDIEVFMAGQ
jgi:hypothetical protein